MGNELLVGDKWVFDRLTGDATFSGLMGRRVFADFAPTLDPATQLPPVYPLTIFSFRATNDTLALGAARALVRPVLTAKVCGQGSGYGAIRAAARRLDELLHAEFDPVDITIDGVVYTVLGAYRTQALQYPEVYQGIRFNYLGGLYQLVI